MTRYFWYAQQKMHKYEELASYYDSLAKHTQPVYFQHCSIRDTQQEGKLERPFFAVTVLLALEADRTGNSFTLMVTASHNPPEYNGLKLDALFADLALDKAQVAQVINSPALTLELARKATETKRKDCTFYLGRDKRPSSSKLAGIIMKVLGILGRRVVDLGERSTPEIFSLSQFLHGKALEGQEVGKEMIGTYFQRIEWSFEQAVQEISANLGKQWLRKRVCLDFANGVGGESFKQYRFILKYLDIISVNDADFGRPNVNCGAEWVCKHYASSNALPDLKHYPSAQQYYFFDGDSDRIIATMQQDRPVDGDDFNACFAKLIKELFDSIGKTQQITVIGTIASSAALGKYLAKIGVHFEVVPVGIREVVTAVRKHKVGCYFQSSGHGAFHFSSQILQMLEEEKEKHWQARVLLHLHGLSLNNSRGYALHNMLIMQLYLFFFSQTSALLFDKDYIFNKEIHLPHPELFANSHTGKKLLQEPAEFVCLLKELQQRFGTQILLRKSSTIPALRLTLQGERNHCEEICAQLQRQLGKYA